MPVTIPYVKQTWTDGVSSCNAARNGVHEDGINDAHYQPCVQVSHNTTQSITNSTFTVLACNTETLDQAGNAASTMHDTVTNNSRLTCRYAGVYIVYAAFVTWSASPVNGWIEFFLNSTTSFGQNNQASGDWRSMATTAMRQLAVNDFVECRVRQISGGALNINSGFEFGMARVG